MSAATLMHIECALKRLSGFPWQDWSDPSNPEQWVYHYTTRDAAIGSILPTGQIRLSLFEWMSDPRESKKWLFGGRGAGEHNLLELSDRTNQLAKAHTKILCVSKDTEDVPVSPNERYQRGFAHSRMWTDYAGRHSGVCLIFDRTKLHEAITNAVASETVYADRMTYSEWTPELGEAFTIELDTLGALGVDRGLLAHIRTYRRELFFHKNLDWASEVEFRWLVFGETPTPEFVPFGDALEGVCVGVNFPASDERTLWYLAETFGISAIPRLTWFNGRVGVQHMQKPGTPPTGGVNLDAILWRGHRTRELEVDDGA